MGVNCDSYPPIASLLGTDECAGLRSIVLFGGLSHQMILVILHDIPEPPEFRRLFQDGKFYPQGNDRISNEIITTFPAYEVEIG